MPHHDKNTVDSPVSPPNRPKTRPKNATTHPGTNAKKILSTRRDPELIEKEKVERQAKKEAKERQKVEEATRKEAAQQHVEDLRAQQAIELRNEESEIAHRPKTGTRPPLQRMSFSLLQPFFQAIKKTYKFLERVRPRRARRPQILPQCRVTRDGSVKLMQGKMTLQYQLTMRVLQRKEDPHPYLTNRLAQFQNLCPRRPKLRMKK